MIPSCTFIRHRPGILTPTLSPPARGPSAERRARPRDSEAQPLRHNLPFVAHKRLTAPQAPPPRSKVRNAVLMAEIDRINHRVRPHPAYVPTEDWLNSACSVVHPYPQFSTAKLMRFAVLPLSYKMRNLESSVPERFGYDYLDSYQPVPLERFRYEYADNFDDETRSIRAQTAALLKRVHSPIPRSRGPLHAVLPTPSSLMETAVPHRHTSDYYIEGLLAPINKVQRDVASRSFYVEHPRPYIGKGNLACMSFAGGKSYAKRRGHYDVPEDHHNVQDDIATLSYYNRARAVANGQEPGPEPAAASSRKSRPYRSTTDSAPAPKADAAPAATPAPRPTAEPIRTASVKEEPAAEAAAEAELAAETQAAPVSNGVSAEEDEAAKLAAEEAELERQLEAELRAEMEAKEAKKAKKAAAKKAKDDEEAKKAAEEAEAKKQAEEAAAKKAEEEAVAAAAAEAAAAAAAEAEAAAAAEAARKAAEEEAEIERQVAAELEAEAKKAAEEVLAAAAAEPAEEVSNEERIEAEAEVAPETEAEADAEPEVAAAEEAEPEPEPEPEPTPEPADEPDPEPEPKVVEAEAEPETAASPEPEAIAEDDPVVEEPESEAVRDEAEEAKSDEDAGWPLDEE